MSRAVALDLGARRIGVAVSDADGSLAFPRPYIARSGDREQEHRAIAEVVDETGATVVVVGLPLSLDGRRGAAARSAVDEAQELAEHLASRGVHVVTFDERFTTVTAEAALGAAGKPASARRRSVDSAAATVLLQAWLDTR